MRNLALTMALIWCGPAQASWQYTEWGMTEDQVLEASNGSLTSVRDTGSPTHFALQGSHDAVGTTFNVMFGFNRQTGGLEVVSLEHVNPSNCARALAALRDKGPPEVEPGSDVYT